MRVSRTMPTPPGSGPLHQPRCVWQRGKLGEKEDKDPARRVSCGVNLDRGVLSVDPGFGYSCDLSGSHLQPVVHHLRPCSAHMPLFIITTSRYDKPLPALPRTEERRRPSSLVLPDTSSTYSHTGSTRSKSRLRYGFESEGSCSSREGSSSPRSSISVPSILKPSRALPDNKVTRRQTERRSTCAYIHLTSES